MMKSRRGKPWFISLAAVVVAVAGLELVLRAAGFGFIPHFFLRGDDGALHANRQFGRLFFPERLVREGVPVRLETPKPAGTFRIFVLGESAAMGFPSPRFGFPRVLECLTREAFPGHRIEVANVAMAGINSHAVRRIARECAALEPDAFVIYLGNNEVVGPFGPGTVFGESTTSLARARTALALRSTKIGQWLDGWLDRLAGRDEARWGGMAMFADRRIPQNHPAMPAVYENFRRNLRDILDATSAVPVVLATVAVNVEDFPPLAGDGARSIYAQAEELRDQGQTAAAREMFLAARDADEMRFRADSNLNEIIRAESKRPQMTLVDVEKLFAARPDNLGDRELFWEHVHLTFEGNYALARAVFDVLAQSIATTLAAQPQPAPSPEQVARKIGFTPAEELYAVRDIVTMLSTAPFSTQPGNEERLAALATRARMLDVRQKAADPEALENDLRAEAAKYPHDPWQLVALATALDAHGKNSESLALKRQIAALFPLDVTTQINLGRAEAAAGHEAPARQAFRLAMHLDRYAVKPVIELAAIAMRENKTAEAKQTLEDFLQLEPQSIEALVARAQIARYEGDNREAAAYLHRAQEIEPENPAVLEELAALNQSSPPQ